MERKGQTIITHNESQTQRLGEKFAKKLRPGDIVALYGDLGAGKTTFVKGIAHGLGVKSRVISPTFILVRRHKTSPKYRRLNIGYLYHSDLYRVENGKDVRGLGLDEIMSNPQNIIAIEWAEKLGRSLPKDRWDVRFEYLNEKKRKIAIEKAP